MKKLNLNTLAKKLVSCVCSVVLVVGLAPSAPRAAFADEGLTSEQEAALEARAEAIDSIPEAYESDEIIVVYRDKAVESKRASRGVTEQTANIEGIAPAEAETIIEDSGVDGGGAALLVDLPEEVSVGQAVAAAEADPDVLLAQPNYKYELLDSDPDQVALSVGEIASADFTPSALPNDPYVSNSSTSTSSGNQWWIHAVNAPTAWDTAHGDNHLSTVAIFDTGITFEHEDLKNNILTSYAYDANNQTALTKSIDDNSMSHGTHVAGIASAEANNGVGIAGAAYNAKILPVKVFEKYYDSNKQAYKAGGCSDTVLMRGYNYLLSDPDGNGKSVAEETGTHVVNMSLGGYLKDMVDAYGGTEMDYYDYAFENLIKRAENEANILTVAAAGNGNTSNIHTPSDYTDVVAVCALASSTSRAYFSDYNEHKNISAPGQNIYSTWWSSSNAYSFSSGTSMASPLVAGCAALLFAYNPHLTPAQVRDAIYTTAVDLGTSGFDSYYGWGRIDIAAALNKVKTLSTSHKWKSASYTWSGYDCTATHTCSICNQSETETATATLASTTTATCETGATQTWRASFSNSSFVAQDKKVVTAALGHALQEHAAHAATCLAQGNIAYWTCTRCGKSYNSTAATTQVDPAKLTSQGGVITAATGHKWSNVSYTWNGHDCTAKRTCSACNAEEKETASATLISSTSAFCETAGSQVWQANFTNSVFGTSSKTETIAAKGHTLRAEPAKAANCVEDGHTAYWICTACGKTFADALGAQTIDITKKVSAGGVIIPPTGIHTFATPVYTWRAHTCTARRVCSVCNIEEKETASATLKSSVAPTCEAAGSQTWEAQFTNAAFATQTFTDTSAELAATGHKLLHVPAKAANCGKDGNIEYWACKSCGKSFTDILGAKPIDATKTVSEGGVLILANGEHSFAAPSYTWNDHDCTAKRVCNVCNTEDTETVSASCIRRVAATCEAAGSQTWRASFTKSVFTTQKKTETLPALGHSLSYKPAKAATCIAAGNTAYWTCDTCGKSFSDTLGATLIDPTKTVSEGGVIIPATNVHCFTRPSYSWNGHACTAKRTCTVCALKEQETVSAILKSSVAPTCETAGSQTWEAQFANAAFQTQTLTDTSADLAATGHKLARVTAKAAGCGENGNIEYWVCTSCGKGFADSLGATLIDTTKTVSEGGVLIPATGQHNFTDPSYTWKDHDCTAKRTCKRCGLIEKETASANLVDEVSSGCTTLGSQTWTATFNSTVFGSKTTTEALAPRGHSWSETAYTWNKNFCTAQHVCTVCGASERETTISSISQKVLPICDEEGFQIRLARFNNTSLGTCEKTISLPATGHKLSYTPAKAASCTEQGHIGYWTCDTCGKSFTDDLGAHQIDAGALVSEGGAIIPEEPHSWDEGITLEAPSEIHEGEALYTCTKCGAQQHVKLAKLSPAEEQPQGEEIDPQEPVAKVPVQLKSAKQTKKSVKLTWVKQAQATQYVIYSALGKKKAKFRKLATTKKTSFNVKKFFKAKKLRKGSYYKFQVIALNAKGQKLNQSKVIYVATKGGKYRNPKAIKLTSVKKACLNLTPGALTKIKAKVTGKKVKRFLGVQYETLDSSVVVVSASGLVQAKKAGATKILVSAQNGITKAINVFVKA